jgi:septum formation protein
MKIILASKSPRRKKILERFSRPFKIINSNFDESKVSKNIDPAKYCTKLASMKAESVCKNFYQELIIAADTIVVLNNLMIGKPKDKSDAFKILTKLSGNVHSVFTGVCLRSVKNNIDLTFSEHTKVTFRRLGKKEIEHYIDNYRPYDKAGSYGIQDASSVFVKHIEGCYDNVVGLPVSRLNKELKKHNINLLEAI